MPIPKSLLTQGLAAVGIGGTLGFLTTNRLQDNSDQTPENLHNQQIETLGIGGMTTAGVLGLAWYASAKTKNPALGLMGAALSAGGAYATAHIYKSLETQRIDQTGDTPSLGSRLLESATGLGALYYGGRALSPYLTRSVAKLDMQFRPWFNAVAETINQTNLGNIGDYASTFGKALDEARQEYSNNMSRYPVQNYLSMIYRVRRELTNTALSQTAQSNAVAELIAKHSVGRNEAINGLRQATLADAMKSANPVFGIDAIQKAGVDLNTIGLGKGVVYDQLNGRILNLNAYSPRKLVENTILGFSEHIKVPLLGINPINLFRPKEFIGALNQGTQFHMFRPGDPIGPGRTAGSKGAAFVGGKLFDVASGEEVTHGGILIKAGTYSTPEGGSPLYHETVFGEILRKRQYGGTYPNKPPANTWWQKTLNALELDIPFLHKTGFAENPSRWDKLFAPTLSKKEKGSVLKAIEDTWGSSFGNTEFEDLKPSMKGKDVFPSTDQVFTKGGKKVHTKTAYAFLPNSDIPGSAAFWLANRPTRLMEDLGLGNFNPTTTKSAADVMWKMFYKRFLPIYASYKLIEGTNDVLGGLPADIGANALAGVNVGAAYLRDILGITDIANYLETLMPGSISSSGSSLMRGIGMPLVAGAYGGKKGLGAGIVASILLGGASTRALTMTGPQTKEEYFGDTRVPIRTGRWWMLGSTAFEGGKVKYFAPNWYKREQADVEDTDVQYGSADERLANVMNPYHFAIKHYADRPYPIVTSGAQELPIFGPLVAGIFSPPMMMHTDELYGGQNGNNGTGFGGYGLAGSNGIGNGNQGGTSFPQPYGNGNIKGQSEQGGPYGVSAQLGGLPPPVAINPDSLKGRAGEEIYRGTEYLGIYGFMVNSANANLTGNQDFFTGPQLESANRITSAERKYWDQNIGDPFGTCFIRGTLVKTLKGEKCIEEIIPGEKVISIDGQPQTVIDILHKKSTKTYRLKISGLGITIEGTRNHHIPVFQPRRYGKSRHLAPTNIENIHTRDVNIQDIKKGDYLVVPLPPHGKDYPTIDLVNGLSPNDDVVFTENWIYPQLDIQTARAHELIDINPNITRKQLRDLTISDAGSKAALFARRHNKKLIRYKRFVKLDKELAYFLGWYLAEGSCEEERVRLSAHLRERNMMEDLGKICVAHNLGNEYRIKETIGTKGIQLLISSRMLVLLIRSITPGKAKTKYIDYCLKSMPIEGKKALLRGLILGDGWFCPRIVKGGFTSVSKTLNDDVFEIAASLGIIGDKTCSYLEIPKHNSFYPQGTPRKSSLRSYVRWQRLDAGKQIGELLGFPISPTQEKKQVSKRSFLKDGMLFVQVKEVQEVQYPKEIDVYDLYIQDKHYYSIGVAVHNTELFRRFIPHRRRQIDLINPIQNTMPNWIPGDEYFTNFHQGDAYNKIELGEMRLPGAGYEQLYTPGAGMNEAAKNLGMINLGMAGQGGPGSDYSMMDTYRILGNVAPYSQQYKYSKDYIMAMSKAGMLDPDTDTERKMLRKEVTQTKRRYSFKERTFTEGSTTTDDVTVDEYLGNGRFTVKGGKGIYKLAGLKGITDEGEKRIQEVIKPGANISAEVLDDDKYKTKTTTVVPTTPTVVGSLNRDLLRSGEAEYKKTGPANVYAPLGRTVKYDPLERLIGGAWEKFSHLDTPINTKLLRNRSALEEWERSQVYGRDSGDWTSPIRDFLGPIRDKMGAASPLKAAIGGAIVGSLFGSGKVSKTLLGVAGGVFGFMSGATRWGAAVPKYRQKEWDVDEYYDILKYLKNERLYNYERQKAIEDEGIDPEKVSQTISASQRARKVVKQAIDEKYGELSEQQWGAADDKTDLKKKIKEQKKSLRAGLSVLSRQKWTEDAMMSELQGTEAGIALQYRQKAMSTMYGADPNGDFTSIMRSLPTKQREFFSAFIQAPQEEREKIKAETPIGMRRFLEAKWGEKVIEAPPDLNEYFAGHYLPGKNWIGWHPAVNLDDVKYKTVQQQGFDQQDFNMWPQQGEEIKRKPYVPLLNPFTNRGNSHVIKQELQDIISAQGYNNYDMSINEGAGVPGMSLSFDVKYATDQDARDYIHKNLRPMMANTYA